MNTVAARIAAFVVAVGLVVGAVVLRSGGTEGITPPTLGGAIELACTAGLDSVCSAVGGLEDLTVRERPATTFLSELVAANTSEDVWLVPAAWVDVADDARARDGRGVLTRSEPIASTPLLLFIWEDRSAVLADRCGVTVEQLGWGCVGVTADRSWESLGGDIRWGRLGLGHASPDTAIGLQATAAVVAGKLGEGYALRELQDPEFTAWFRAVEDAVRSYSPSGGSHLRAMVVTGPSVADVAVGTEAEATTLLGRQTSFGRILAVPASPVLAVELVVAGLDDRAVRDAEQALTAAAAQSALSDLGWRLDGVPPSATPLTGPVTVDETPNGGVLTALRTVWDQVAR